MYNKMRLQHTYMIYVGQLEKEKAGIYLKFWFSALQLCLFLSQICSFKSTLSCSWTAVELVPGLINLSFSHYTTVLSKL